ncbi:MAG: 1-deoxy-D-xylulose-5-phosphate reductoisomerase [Rhodothermia bacterium]
MSVSRSNNGAASPRSLAILGSTGSIGRQAIEVVGRFPDLFRVDLLTAGSNADLLIEQAKELNPSRVVIADSSVEPNVRQSLAGLPIRVESGTEALIESAAEPVDLVLAAMVGYAGLRPVLRAAEAGIPIALANKEALVVAGSLLTSMTSKTGAPLIPVDSEHSAIFQCLEGEDRSTVQELILTASGGPFRDRPSDTFGAITRQEALAHPNWSMGSKITIDSATMMNKGLELIEAHWLFGLQADDIRILVHPQSIVHSMVLFTDGSIKAQMSMPDMQLPIQYALSYPGRLPSDRGRINWNEITRFDFRAPDPARFPCIGMAHEALIRGGTAPAILNAANEEAVSLFLDGRIAFTEISELIGDAISNVEVVDNPEFEDLENADANGRRWVKELKRVTTN